MISCIIVDDEQHAIDLLRNHVSKLPLLDLRFATTNPIEAFDYVNRNRTDLVFLDIHMPELDGIQFLKLLKGRSKVILTTAYSEYTLDGYEHDIADYLLKPIVFDRFLKAVQKVVDHLTVTEHTFSYNSSGTLSDDDFIFVKTDGRSKIVRILLKDIDYIEGLGNYLSIHSGSSRIITLLTIKELEEKLPGQHFIRIHNSYIIPFNKIIEVEGNQVRIGKRMLPVGEVYKKAFMTAIEKHIMKNKK